MSKLWTTRRILVCFFALAALAGTGNSNAAEVKVALPTMQTATVPVTPESTVLAVKEFIFNITEIHPMNQRMFKGTVVLDDAKTLKSYGIADGDTLVVKYGTAEPPTQENSGGFLKIAGLVALFAVLLLVIRKILPR